MITMPCDKNAIPEVHRVLEYLNSIEGKSIITGQHTQSMGMEEVECILQETGQLPALCGFELLAYSPNINWGDAGEECLAEIKEAAKTLNKAKKPFIYFGGGLLSSKAKEKSCRLLQL